MERMAIVIRDDSYDKILTPLVFAYLAAGTDDVEVDILFVNWAALAMTEKGAAELVIDGRHASHEALIRQKVAEAGLQNDILTILRALKETGKVRFYVCSLAARIFGVDEENILPEAEGIVGASWIMNEKMEKADHCQYF